MRTRSFVSAWAAIVLAASVSPSFAQQLAQNKATQTAPAISTGGIIVATIVRYNLDGSPLAKAK